MLTSKAPLTPYEGFRASTFDDLVRVVESRLNARLRKAPKAVSIDAFANSAKLTNSHLWFCSYGAPLTLQFNDDDYLRVQFAHTGSGTTFVGKNATSVTATQCCVSPAGALIEFTKSFQQVAWRIDPNVLTKKLAALTGTPIMRKLDFNPVLAINNSRASGLPSILRCILAHLAQPTHATHPFVLEELEQALIVSLLCNGEHNFRHLLDNFALPTVAPRQVRLVEEYIEANWDKSFRIEDMVALTGASVRSIYRAFQSSRRYSPSEFLRQQRLMQARKMLESSGKSVTVMQVAIACGFSNSSRFSKEFFKAYGESPSRVRSHAETRRG